MGLFRKKPTITIPPRQPVVVSIEPHESARKEAFDEATKINKRLNTLLVENGFTLKLWVATGGHFPEKADTPTKGGIKND